MRDLERNKQTVHYSCLSSTATTDEFGNPAKAYTTPKAYRISISASKGEAEEQIFGKELKYSRVMITHNMDCEIDEYSRIWIERSILSSHNYEVVAVSKSLNCCAYAIKRVDIS